MTQHETELKHVLFNPTKRCALFPSYRCVHSKLNQVAAMQLQRARESTASRAQMVPTHLAESNAMVVQPPEHASQRSAAHVEAY